MPDSVKVKMFLLSEENGLSWAPAQFEKIIKTWVRCLHDNHCSSFFLSFFLSVFLSFFLSFFLCVCVCVCMCVCLCVTRGC
jgi:hypothetical protein